MKFLDLKKEIVIDNRIKEFIRLKLTAIFEDIVRGFHTELILRDEIKIPIKNGDYFDKLDYLDQSVLLHPFAYIKKCESPIELSFFIYSLNKIPELKPQIIVGPYRVDFAVPNKKVLIELDGHDFHKTREQRTYDAKRDRYLLTHGWKVLRFTGTEINKDVMACVDEAKKIISTLASIN